MKLKNLNIMDNLKEMLYDKKIIDAIDKLTEGLNKIEYDNKELFEETPFSKYYYINFPPSAMLIFTKEVENLPNFIIEEAKTLCKAIAAEAAND